jgi:hypothetical protein
MSENSKIEWCDHTFNPWEGCQKVGPGCDHCYAETRNARFGGGVAINWGRARRGAARRQLTGASRCNGMQHMPSSSLHMAGVSACSAHPSLTCLTTLYRAPGCAISSNGIVTLMAG